MLALRRCVPSANLGKKLLAPPLTKSWIRTWWCTGSIGHEASTKLHRKSKVGFFSTWRFGSLQSRFSSSIALEFDLYLPNLFNRLSFCTLLTFFVLWKSLPAFLTAFIFEYPFKCLIIDLSNKDFSHFLSWKTCFSRHLFLHLSARGHWFIMADMDDIVDVELVKNYILWDSSA